jgi:hypothetical protein
MAAPLKTARQIVAAESAATVVLNISCPLFAVKSRADLSMAKQTAGCDPPHRGFLAGTLDQLDQLAVWIVQVVEHAKFSDGDGSRR